MGYVFKENPNARAGYQALEGFAGSQGLGIAGRQAKRMLREGDYSMFLNPIKDSYATSQREGEREATMGGNAFQQGAQPALMAGLQSEARLRNQEGLGMALSSAMPQAFQTLSGVFQNAKNEKDQTSLSALQGAMQGRLGSGQFVNQPGFWDRFTQVLGAAGGMASGLGSMGAKI